MPSITRLIDRAKTVRTVLTPPALGCTVLAPATGLEILSPDPDWPCVDVAGRQRPDVLA